MFSSLLQPVLNAIYPCSIEEIRNSKQKELRIIDTLEPLLNQHRLVIDYTALKNDIEYSLQDTQNTYYSMVFQLTHLNRERGSLIHDDRLDAITLGVQWWNDYGILKQDSSIALELYNKKLIADELRRRAGIFNKMNGGSRGSNSFAISRLKSFKN